MTGTVVVYGLFVGTETKAEKTFQMFKKISMDHHYEGWLSSCDKKCRQTLWLVVWL